MTLAQTPYSYSRADTSASWTAKTSTAPHHSKPELVDRGDETARVLPGPRAKSEPMRAVEREPLADQVAVPAPLPAVSTPESLEAAAAFQ